MRRRRLHHEANAPLRVRTVSLAFARVLDNLFASEGANHVEQDWEAVAGFFYDLLVAYQRRHVRQRLAVTGDQARDRLARDLRTLEVAPGHRIPIKLVPSHEFRLLGGEPKA